MTFEIELSWLLFPHDYILTTLIIRESHIAKRYLYERTVYIRFESIDTDENDHLSYGYHREEAVQQDQSLDKGEVAYHTATKY